MERLQEGQQRGARPPRLSPLPRVPTEHESSLPLADPAVFVVAFLPTSAVCLRTVGLVHVQLNSYL